MKLSKTAHILSSLALLFSLSACAPVFENNADVQARQALLDLAKIQESYHAENSRYARNLVEIEKYNLKYHNGIVYLEIESAGRDKYRAISLPAESTTARVFAYDTDQGGFYEMDEEEVARYVLGALNYLRGEMQKQNSRILLSSILMGTLAILGFRFIWRYKEKENLPALGSYFTSLLPLGWSVATLTAMDSDITFSTQITIYSAGACVLALISFLTTALWMKNRNPLIVPSSLVGLAICTLFISMISVGAVIRTFVKFYP